MAVTQNTYTGNGSTVLYSFTFPYLETTDIKVSVNGTVTTAYTLANATTIQFNTAPANGAAIRIYRQTDDSDLSATFYPGSAIRSQDLNDNFTQNLYVTQEVHTNSVNIDGSNPMVGNLNMNGFQIDNLGAPTSDTDAVNRAYVNSIVANGIGDGDKGDIVVSGSGATFTIDSGAITDSKIDASANIASSKLAFTQAGTGAVQRTVESKLQDVVSILDFGAIEGNDQSNAAINTAAFYAAIDTGKAIYVPAGTFWVNPMTLTRSANIFGADINKTIIRRVGTGATFRWTDKATNTFRKMTLYGNGYGITFHYDYGPGLDTGENIFDEIYCRSDDYGIKVQCTAVFWRVTNCYFNGLNVAREFGSGAWAYREYGNWTWYCFKGLVVKSSGFSNSLVNCVMQDVTEEAVIIDANTGGGGQIGEWLFESVFFEACGKTGTNPIVDLRTSAVARLHNVTFDSCIFTPGPHPNPTYLVQLTPGGGGSLRKIKFRNNFFNYGAVPTTNWNNSSVIFENNEFSDLTVGDDRIRDEQTIPLQTKYSLRNVIAAQDGLATAPSFTFVDDLDTGIYRLGADELGVATSGLRRMRFRPNGQILVNSDNNPSSAYFYVDGGAGALSFASNRSGTTSSGHFEFRNDNGVVGSIRTSGSTTSYNTSSDYRLKENVSPITDGITRLKALKPHRFNFISDPSTVVDGFLAHEVQAVIPEAISGVKDEVNSEGDPVYQGIDQSKLVPLLTAALQEAITRIEALEAQVQTLSQP